MRNLKEMLEKPTSDQHQINNKLSVKNPPKRVQQQRSERL